MFSCEFYEIFKNTFFTEHLQVTAFDNTWYNNILNIIWLFLLKKSKS